MMIYDFKYLTPLCEWKWKISILSLCLINKRRALAYISLNSNKATRFEIKINRKVVYFRNNQLLMNIKITIELTENHTDSISHRPVILVEKLDYYAISQ
jgi:hypothetical protein